MINLLPPADQLEIRAGRANHLLLRYITMSLIVLGILLAWIGFIYFNLYTAKATAEQVKRENDAKAVTKQSVVDEANKFRADLTIAKQIMEKQVNYTDTVTSIAAAMPDGTILDNVTIDPKLFDKDVTLSAHAKSSEAAIALKDKLQDSGLFKKVSFQSVTQVKQQGSEASAYPYAVVLDISFNRSEVTR